MVVLYWKSVDPDLSLKSLTNEIISHQFSVLIDVSFEIYYNFCNYLNIFCTYDDSFISHCMGGRSLKQHDDRVCDREDITYHCHLLLVIKHEENMVKIVQSNVM